MPEVNFLCEKCDFKTTNYDEIWKEHLLREEHQKEARKRSGSFTEAEKQRCAVVFGLRDLPRSEVLGFFCSNCVLTDFIFWNDRPGYCIVEFLTKGSCHTIAEGTQFMCGKEVFIRLRDEISDIEWASMHPVSETVDIKMSLDEADVMQTSPISPIYPVRVDSNIEETIIVTQEELENVPNEVKKRKTWRLDRSSLLPQKVKKSRLDLEKQEEQQSLPVAAGSNLNVSSADKDNKKPNYGRTLCRSPEQVIEVMERLPQCVEDGTFTHICCGKIGVGDFVFKPQFKLESRVFVSKIGVYFEMPHAGINNNKKMVKIGIPLERVVETTVHFTQRLPCIFLKTTSEFAVWIRNTLGMNHNSNAGNYYSPANGAECQKYIVFNMLSINDAAYRLIKKTFASTLNEIKYTEANSLLIQRRCSGHNLSKKTSAT